MVWIVGSSTQKRTRPTRNSPIAAATARPDQRAAAGEQHELLRRHRSSENAPVATAATANLNATSPDASLIRLSPFRMCVTRDGSGSRAGHRGGRDRVGRRHDRAERERRGERQRRDEPVHQVADDDDGRGDEPEREQQDRPQEARRTRASGTASRRRTAAAERTAGRTRRGRGARRRAPARTTARRRRRRAASAAAAASTARARRIAATASNSASASSTVSMGRIVLASEPRARLARGTRSPRASTRGRGSRCDADSGRSGG